MFAEDSGVSRSAAMSMIMTAVLRGAMPVAPMHVITKPEAGTGGSYLQDLVAAIAIGERCPVISFMPDDDKENEKRLGAAALTQQPIIALDNLSSTLMGDFLCQQLISQPVLQVRILGRSDLMSVVNSAFVIANGNNLVIGADTVRRVVQIAARYRHGEPGSPLLAQLSNRRGVGRPWPLRGRRARRSHVRIA